MEEEEELAQDKSRAKAEAVHSPNCLVISFMGDRGFDYQPAHVEIVVIFCQEHLFGEALEVIRGIVQGGAECHLERPGQAGGHKVFNKFYGFIEHCLSFPVVADHNSYVWVQSVFLHPGKTGDNVVVLIAFIEAAESFVVG